MELLFISRVTDQFYSETRWYHVEGCLCANLQGDTLQVGIRQMDISEIYVYTEQTPKTVIVNGKEVPFEANDRFIVFKAK